MPSTSLWTPSALPPGSILLASLPQFLWRRHQTHNLRSAWYEITLCSRFRWPRPFQILHSFLASRWCFLCFQVWRPCRAHQPSGRLVVWRSSTLYCTAARETSLSGQAHCFEHCMPPLLNTFLVTFTFFLNIPFVWRFGRAASFRGAPSVAPLSLLDVAFLFPANNKGYLRYCI